LPAADRTPVISRDFALAPPATVPRPATLPFDLDLAAAPKSDPPAAATAIEVEETYMISQIAHGHQATAESVDDLFLAHEAETLPNDRRSIGRTFAMEFDDSTTMDSSMLEQIPE
jgi:hypothetical protein